MIKTVLIDDERPALRGLEHLLKKYPEISIVGMYTNPLKAIDEIGRIMPDIVFLDINMPQLKGIDAASRVLDTSPDTDIVFVTAFDQYAVEAFELHALDYLLKPVNPERLLKTVERLLKKQPSAKDDSERKLQIKCLGRFQVSWENGPPIKWRTEKTRELFAFLLQHQGREITKEELLDMLWPDDDPEKAIRQLYNGIYYIRKALDEYGISRNLISIDGNYNLKLRSVNYDVGRLHELGKIEPTDDIKLLEEMEALFTGDYLEGDDYLWAVFEAEKLDKLYRQCLIRLSELYIENKKFDKAENTLLKVYTKNPYEETVTELLLKLYAQTGEKSKAVRHFNAYTKLLTEELGIKPSEKLIAIYRTVK